MKPELKRPRGTQDVLPPQGERIERLRRGAFDTAERFGYGYIETPAFEQSAVFFRVGETTDIVQHESYRFTDAGGVDLTLRPEGTAAVARAYVENGLYALAQPQRLFYWGPMFRRERPQAGRFRQHTQFGAELYGSDSPLADAEIILLATAVVEVSGLQGPVVRINSLGCADCRGGYRNGLIAYYRSHREKLCPDCQVRLETNPLRLLDCKVDLALKADAPDIALFWCADCREHLETVTRVVEQAGRQVSRDPWLVRGLDYYTRTVFEVGHPSLGAGVALFGGGRYDGLSQALGGPAAPAVGFGMGVERLLSAVPEFQAEPLDRVYVAAVEESLRETAFEWVNWLRSTGWAAECDLLGRSLKAQLKEAGRRCRWALLVGGSEWARGEIVVRDLTAGIQASVDRNEREAVLAHLNPSI